MFEKACKAKLRFSSERGLLSVEDLFDLSLQKLNKMAKTLNKELKASIEEDFLEEKSEEDVLTKLRFDIVLRILNLKKSEKKAKSEASSKRVEKERLLGLLERKQHESDESLTEEELKQKIADLS